MRKGTNRNLMLEKSAAFRRRHSLARLGSAELRCSTDHCRTDRKNLATNFIIEIEMTMVFYDWDKFLQKRRKPFGGNTIRSAPGDLHGVVWSFTWRGTPEAKATGWHIFVCSRLRPRTHSGLYFSVFVMPPGKGVRL
jgi:hypothetical protein